MKQIEILLLALLLLIALTACGGSEAPAPETPDSLLLVESRPETQPTQAETQPPHTLPAFVEEARKPETVPETTAAPTLPRETVPQTKPAESPRPVITKSPTSESVEAGGEAWFVAHADGADGVRWWLTPPDSEKSRTPEQTRSAFPGLTASGHESDTFVLGQIPQDLSGWTLKAEFYNDSGSTWTEAALLTVTQPVGGVLPAAYASVLENCRFVLRYDPAVDSAQTLGQYDYHQLYDGHDLLGGGLGYAMMDVNGNGSQELIIGCPGRNSFGEKGGDMIYALFTLHGDAPIKVLQSWPAHRFYLSKGGRLYQEEDLGNGLLSFTRMDLLDLQLIPVEVLWTEHTDEGLVSFYSPNGSRDPISRQRVADPRFYELQASMVASRLPLPALTDILP